MSTKSNLIGLTIGTLALLSCGGGKGQSEQDWEEELASETVLPDTLFMETEEELLDGEDANPHLDDVFDDFLFAYIHSPKLRRERTAPELQLLHSERPAETLENFDPGFEFAFLSGEFLTSLYGSSAQMQAEDDEELEGDTLVCVQRINLNDGTIRNFRFQRQEGRWLLGAIEESTFGDDRELGSFLQFYARFCNDSTVQSQSIANPLRVVLQDEEEEDGYIDGTIDADQWRSFCPDVPSGIISNIRREDQHYNDRRIVLRKSGLSNGMQEVFTFTRDHDSWRLSRYEN